MIAMTQQSLKGKRILVVDDDVEFVAEIVRQLSDAGCRVGPGGGSGVPNCLAGLHNYGFANRQPTGTSCRAAAVCPRDGERNQIMSRTDYCCEPTFTLCSILASSEFIPIR